LHLPDFSNQTPKAVALDLDETTLNSKTELTDRTRSAIQDVISVGVPVVIATSRPERVLPVLIGEDIMEVTSLVQMNGTIAEGRNGLSGSIRYPIPINDALTTWELVNQRVPQARMTLELDGTRFAVNHDDDVDELWAFNKATPTMLVDFDQALQERPTKVSIWGIDVRLGDLAEELETKLSPETVIYGAANAEFLNVVPKSATKSGSVEHLLRSSNIGLDEVMSFGDDHVDIDLIRDCGWSVAVANAIPLIKEHAKFITASNEDHGVAVVLEKLVNALR
jgi:Cof subfamily protein (haloacid dehalogenase superfamily)